MSVNDETFRLLLDGQEVPIVSDYRVKSGVFDVPAAFNMKVGHSGLTSDLLAFYPEFTPFELLVGDIRVQTGELDRLELVGELGTEVRLSGREMLKWLTDVRLNNTRTFSEKTFIDLTKVALKEVGLGDKVVALNNVANRKAITGSDEVQIPPTTEETETQVGEPGATRTVYKTLKAEVGTTWWEFLKSQYRRAGLFLWNDANGGFILSKPDGGQKPLYRIVRRRGGTAGDVTVLGQPKFFRDAKERYSECEVLGRAGGGKDGRGQISGKFIDEEMVAILNRTEADRADGGKRKKPFVIHDKLVRTKEQANFLAKRKIAETRRNGFSLGYWVSGHMVKALTGGGWLAWQKDTVVHLIDEELGIDSPMYIEDVEYLRSPETRTFLALMRPEDLIFAEEDFDTIPKPKARPPVRIGKTELFKWEKDPRRGNLPTARWQAEDGSLRGAEASDLKQRGNQVVVTSVPPPPGKK